MAKGLRRSLFQRSQGYLGGVREPVILEVVKALSAANIIAMFASPIEVIPAPGPNKIIIAESVLFKMTRTATAFTGGGAISLKYAGGAILSNTIPASVVTTGGAGVEYSHIRRLRSAVTPVVNAAVQIANATAAFAAGTGTADLVIRYQVVPA